MRKDLAKKIFALLLTAIMLITTYLPITAASVSVPGNAATEEELYYSVTYEGGILKVKINPQKVYEILEDRNLTREELLKFVPEDILQLLNNRDSLSAEDLMTVVSSYISVDDLLKIVEDIPEELRASLIDIKLLENIITVNELLSVIPVDTLASAVEFKYIEALLTDEVLELMLKDEIINDVLDDSFITDLIENTTIINDVFADPTTKEKLFALLTDAVITKMMTDTTVGPLLSNYMFSDTVVNKVADDKNAVKALTDYVTAAERKGILEGFLSDPDVANVLLHSSTVKEIVLKPENLKAFVTNGVITKEIVAEIFTEAQLKTLVTADVINTLVGNATFINNVFNDTVLVEKILTASLISKLAKLNSVVSAIDLVALYNDPNNYLTVEELEDAGAVNTAAITYSYIKGKGLTATVLIQDGIINTSAFDAEKLIFTDKLITYDDLTDSGIIDMSAVGDPTLETILTAKIESGVITPSYVLDKNIVDKTKLTPEILYAEGILTDSDLSTYNITLPEVLGGTLTAEKKNEIILDKIGKKVLTVNVIKSLNALTIPTGLAETLYADGKITVSDLETYGILDMSRVDDDFIEDMASKKIDSGVITTAYLEANGIINTSKLTASYILGKISIDTLRQDGIINTGSTVVGKLIDNGAITPANIRTFLGDAKIKDIILNNADAKNILIDHILNSTDIKVSDYWGHVDLVLVAGKIDMNKVAEYAEDDTTYRNMIEKLVDNDLVHKAFESLGDVIVHDIVEKNISELLHEHDIAELFISTYGRENLVSVLGGYQAVIEKFGLRDGAVAAIGGYGALVKFFDPMDIVDAIGVPTVMEYVDLEDLIQKLGGYGALLSYYSNEEISKIIETIGYKNLIKFVQDSELAKKVDLKAIGSDIIDLIRAKDPDLKVLGKEIAQRIYKLLMTEVNSLTLNGTEIFSAGKFDLNRILVTVIRAIPDVEDFISIGVDGKITSLLLGAEMTSGSYSFGMEFSWIGDPSELNAFIEAYKEHFKLDVSDELDITLSVTAPGVLSDIYEKALTSDKVPAALKEAMLTLPQGDVKGVIDFLSKLEDAEIKSIHEAVAPKIDSISAKAYSAIDKLDNISAKAAQKLKAEVDRITDAFASAENLKNFIDSAVNKLNEKLPDKIKNLGVMEFYVENGTFRLKKSFEQDLYERINSFISLPKEIKILFTGNDMTVSGTVDATVSLGNIYKLHLVTETDAPMDIFLPAGITLIDTLKNIPALADDLPNGLWDVDLNSVTEMPNGDVTLYTTEVYTVIFKVGTEEYATVRYPKGATAIQEPALPTARPGYTNSWSQYTLGSAATITATLVETPNAYKVIYVDETGASLNADYSFTFGTLTAADVESNAPAKKGHSLTLGAYDITAAGDITVKVTYTANTYTVTYVDAGGNPIGTAYSYKYGEATTDTVKANAPTKKGHSLEISGFDAELDANQTVTVTYSANTYTITYVDTKGDPIGTAYSYKYGEATTDTVKANAPTKKGHSFTLSAFDLTLESDQTVTVTYTANTYTVTYVDAGGNPIGTAYSYKYGEATADTVKANAPQLKGHTASIKGFDPELDANQTVTVTYSPNTYILTYKTGDGKIRGSFTYSYGSTAQYIRNEILKRLDDHDGYTVTFSAFDAELAKNQTVIITFVPNTYTFTFTDADKNVIASFDFEFGTLTDALVRSKIPAKEGHSADLSDYDATVAGNISVVLTYVPNKYKVTFMAEDKVTIIDELTFTYGDKALSGVPNVPEKLGYTGKWEDYTLGADNLTVYPEYTAIKYTARFVYEDGTTYKEIIFTVETESLEEPEVPAKDGYTGKWEDYTLSAADITIRPIYTPVESDEPDTPTTTPEPPADDDGGCKGVIWWVIAAILLVLLAALAVMYFLRQKKLNGGNGTTPPPSGTAEG